MPAPPLLGLFPAHLLSLFPCALQNLWFANPGGSNSMPSQSRSSVQRTHSLPVHSSPQAILMFPPGKVPQSSGFCLRNTFSWPFSSLLGLIHSSTSPHTSHQSVPISLQSGFSYTLPHPQFSLLSQVLPSFISSHSCMSTSLPSCVIIFVSMLVCHHLFGRN